jgi:hypothetical protein
MWVKLDDSFPDHPKIARLSDAAFRLHIRALCYCARFLTDGDLPSSFCRVSKAVKEVVQAGLWEPLLDGWRVHDWLAYNRTKAQVLAEREKAERRRNVAHPSGDESPTDERASAAPSSPVPVPVPVPVPEPVPDQSFSAIAGANGAGVWAVMVELWGEPPKAQRYRTAWGEAKKEIIAQGVSPEEIRRRYGNAGTRTWAIATPSAFAKHLGLLVRPEPNSRKPTTTDRMLGLADELERRGE